MRKAALPIQRVLGGDQLLTLANDMHLADVSALYAAIGENHVSAQSVVQKLVAQLGGTEGAVEDIAEAVVPSRRDRRRSRRRSTAATAASWSRASRTSGSSSPAAARRCPATTSSASSPAAGECRCTAAPAPTPPSLLEQPDRLVDVEWAPSADSTFVVSIQVEALDRHGLLSDVTRVLSDERVSILSANVSTTRDRVAVSKFTFEMAEAKHLGHLLRAIRNVEGVYDVYRVHAQH